MGPSGLDERRHAQGRANAYRVLLASISWLVPPALSAAEAPVFSPSIYLGMLQDSNLFRLPSEDQAEALLGTRDRSVSAVQYGGGLDVVLPVRRQRFDLSLQAIRNEYDEFDYLDHTDLSARARWHWQYGRLWNGELRLRYREHLSPFDEFDQVEKDMRTMYEASFGAVRGLNERWTAGLSAAHGRFEHDFQPRRAQDRSVDTVAVELRRLGLDPRSSVGLRAQSRSVSYPNRVSVDGAQVDNSHMEHELSLDAQWEASAKSSLSGRIGYATVRHDELSDRDFSGQVGLLRYRYRATDRTEMQLAAWRDIDALTVSASSYVVETGVGVRPSWQYSQKLSLAIDLSYLERRYEGDPQQEILGLPTRKDDFEIVEVSLSYSQFDSLLYSLSYRAEDRDSNRAARRYRYDLFTANVRWTF